MPDWFYAERIEADARDRQGGAPAEAGGGDAGVDGGVFLRTGVAVNKSLIKFTFLLIFSLINFHTFIFHYIRFILFSSPSKSNY